jgi:hypothetical protein
MQLKDQAAIGFASRALHGIDKPCREGEVVRLDASLLASR